MKRFLEIQRDTSLKGEWYNVIEFSARLLFVNFSLRTTIKHNWVKTNFHTVENTEENFARIKSFGIRISDWWHVSQIQRLIDYKLLVGNYWIWWTETCTSIVKWFIDYRKIYYKFLPRSSSNNYGTNDIRGDFYRKFVSAQNYQIYDLSHLSRNLCNVASTVIAEIV